MDYIIIFTISSIISLFLTPLVRKLMEKLGVISRPSKSRWNPRPVALMGGIAVFISFIISVFLRTQFDRKIIILLTGSLIMFILGLFDDRQNIHPKIKFSIQLIVGITIALLGLVSKILPYYWLNIILTLVWIVGITNALNMIDNMDGLSSGVAIISAMGLFGLSIKKEEINIALLSLALAGSCLGFLKYNFKPAKIFMGDCGSLFIGYTLAGLAVLGGWQRNSSSFGSIFSPILILSVIIFDTTLVTILRLKHKRKPWQGGKDHSSHRLVHILKGKEELSVFILYGIGGIASFLGLMVVNLSSINAIIITALWLIILILFGMKLAKVKCYDQ